MKEPDFKELMKGRTVLKELREVDFGEPLHSLILCAPHTHEMELEMLNYFNVKNLKK